MNVLVKTNSHHNANGLPKPLGAEREEGQHIDSLKKRFPEFKDKTDEEMLEILNAYEKKDEHYSKRVENAVRVKRMKDWIPATGLDTERRAQEELKEAYIYNAPKRLSKAMNFTQQALDKWTTPSHIEKLVDSKIHLNDLQGHLSHIYNKPISPRMIECIEELVFSGKALLRDLMVGKLDGEYGPESINFL